MFEFLIQKRVSITSIFLVLIKTFNFQSVYFTERNESHEKAKIKNKKQKLNKKKEDDFNQTQFSRRRDQEEDNEVLGVFINPTQDDDQDLDLNVKEEPLDFLDADYDSLGHYDGQDTDLNSFEKDDSYTESKN